MPSYSKEWTVFSFVYIANAINNKREFNHEINQSTSKAIQYKTHDNSHKGCITIIYRSVISPIQHSKTA